MTLSRYHPTVDLLFFTAMPVFTLALPHPLCLGLSFFCALFCAADCKGNFRSCRYLLPLFLLTMVINGLCNHQGMTVLCYLPWGNPLTLESLIYGFRSAVMLVTAVLWFSCLSETVSSDQFVYLFGRVIPVLSLLLSMTLRFVPRFLAQGRKIAAARHAAGTPHGKFRSAAETFSILLTWSLESAVDTANSMKSRGYGLPGRTFYSIFRLTPQDKILLGYFALCIGLTVWGWAAGKFDFQYFPLVQGAPLTLWSILWFAGVPALGLTPLLLRRKEDRLWKKSSCKI